MSDETNPSSNRLASKAVQEELIDVFSQYYFELRDIFTVATVENNGRRPRHILNEIFSCFHHIARGICEDSADISKELRAAKNSHIKRASLDSYKIAINASLDECKRTLDLLDYLVLAEDFTRYIPDGLNKVNEIKSKRKRIKRLYCDAKRLESGGDFDKCIAEFNSALENCYELKDLLDIFTSDKTYLLACAREQRQRKEHSANRKVVILSSLISGLLATLLTIAANQYLESNSDPNSSSPRAISD